jgi:hypothetical protein
VPPGQSIEGYVLGHLESWGCIEAGCEDLLPCGGPPEEQDFVLLAAALGTTKAEAMAYLKKYPGKVEYVQERKAVQIVRCNGVIIAHLPLRAGPVRIAAATRAWVATPLWVTQQLP